VGGIDGERDRSAGRQCLVGRRVDGEPMAARLDRVDVAGAAEEALAHDAAPGVSRPGVSVRATIHARKSASTIASPVLTSERPTVFSSTTALGIDSIAR